MQRPGVRGWHSVSHTFVHMQQLLLQLAGLEALSCLSVIQAGLVHLARITWNAQTFT